MKNNVDRGNLIGILLSELKNINIVIFAYALSAARPTLLAIVF